MARFAALYFGRKALQSPAGPDAGCEARFEVFVDEAAVCCLGAKILSN